MVAGRAMSVATPSSATVAGSIMRTMTRQLLLELPEELAANAEKQAKRLARPVEALVQEALVDYLGWRAVEETRAASTELREADAERLAYAELDQLRDERAPG
jgi:hypothetical protein